jgi:PKD repeat protein
MYKLLLSIILFSAMGICNAQPGEWVWIHGANTINNAGVFGVQGIIDPANNPPGLYEACEWTDQIGNFWLYGGLKFSYQEFGDLWKYDPTLNQWVWMKGMGTTGTPANYGTMGIPSATNDPGSRAWGMASWVDNQGNFWMFGGMRSGNVFADLWRYEPATNNWTWMKGPQSSGSNGVYGIQGVSNPANFPGCRYETATTWTDNAGDLWLFGGNNFGATRNDLWRYNISSNEWTWMKGSQFTGAADVYGVQGIEDPANTPGSRDVYSHWKDLNGNFWLFGGSNNVNNDYNDLWRYNPITNNWAWFKGGTGNAIYGSQCVADTLNTPGKRFENRATVTDANGNLWLFGGGLGNTFQNCYNDLWKYCVSSNSWTWVSGDNSSNPTGNWGTLGVSSPLNKPDARAGAVMWTDQLNHLYMFGGTNSAWASNYNDIWMYTIDPSCAPCSSTPQALFSAPNQICPGTCTDFTNASVNSNSFQWIFPGGNPGISTDVNPTNICYNTPGSYDVTLIAINGASSDTSTLIDYITVFPAPPPQGILQSGDTLSANQGAVSYQWYSNGNLIPGATEYFYVATESGNFNVVATDSNGCEVEAVIFDVVAGLSQFSVGNGQLAIFPNPVIDNLEIRNLTEGKNLSIIIYNNIAEKVFESKAEKVTTNLSIDVSSLTAGIYYLEVYDGKISAKIVFTKK